ncbi:MAG TPA: AzlD domain-containing protein [Actinomycetaceae bacterium]|nr:AzlD domain-containing protein [Actinomycetaceae bacterium]
MWAWILLGSAIAYLTKLAGYLVPDAALDHPKVSRVTSVLTIALLGALVVMNTFGSGTALALDARIGALAVAAIALMLRAPFLLVVVLGAAATAALRLLGWG